MLRSSCFLAMAALLGAGVACNSGRHSSSGFRLPADGDVQRGQVAFVSLGCSDCHRVAGVDLPRPTVQPPVPVVLGGEVYREVTDGYLTTSIIHPSYQLAYYPKDQITSHGQSRMPHYTERLTVRELTDLVAFLQAHYTVVQVSPSYTYH